MQIFLLSMIVKIAKERDLRYNNFVLSVEN